MYTKSYHNVVTWGRGWRPQKTKRSLYQYSKKTQTKNHVRWRWQVSIIALLVQSSHIQYRQVPFDSCAVTVFCWYKTNQKMGSKLKVRNGYRKG